MAWSPSLESVKVVPLWAVPPSIEYDVDATPDVASTGASVTVTLLLTQELETPEMPVIGAVLSMLTFALVALVVLPALSDTEALAVRFEPSLEIVLSPGTVAG